MNNSTQEEPDITWCDTCQKLTATWWTIEPRRYYCTSCDKEKEL